MLCVRQYTQELGGAHRSRHEAEPRVTIPRCHVVASGFGQNFARSTAASRWPRCKNMGFCLYVSVLSSLFLRSCGHNSIRRDASSCSKTFRDVGGALWAELPPSGAEIRSIHEPSSWARRTLCHDGLRGNPWKEPALPAATRVASSANTRSDHEGGSIFPKPPTLHCGQSRPRNLRCVREHVVNLSRSKLVELMDQEAARAPHKRRTNAKA